jgi:putative ABC transport system permease protein
MNFGQELRIATRRLLKDPWFTAVAVLALGAGIGVNNTFFTLVNAAVLRGLPIDNAEDVLVLGMRDRQNVPRGLSYPEYDDLQRNSRAFAGAGAYTTSPMTIVEQGMAPDRVLGASWSASGFGLLGVRPRLGRDFLPQDDRPGAPVVVLLSDQLWHTRYGGAPAIIGRLVTLNGEAATVIGVMPEGFRFPGNVDVWRPLASAPGLVTTSRDARTLTAFARLAATANRAAAEAEFGSLTAAWAKSEPAAYDGLRPATVPINQQFFGRVTDTVWLAFITAGVLVFLIACANVANLLLMRAAGRGREMAVRVSLGATRTRIVRQLLAEAAVLATLAGTTGAALSYLALRLLQSQVPADVARLFAFTLEGRVLLVLLCASAASVLLFALAPALHVARAQPGDVLKDGGPAGGAVARHRLSTAFLAAEFALTVVLLANVALSIRVIRATQDAEVAIDPSPLLTMSITLPNQPYGTADARHGFLDRLRERIAALPSVSSAAVASALPGGGGQLRELTIAGRPTPSTAGAPSAVAIYAGEDYFDTIGVRLLRGRSFGPTDGTAGADTVIINERLSTLFFPNEEPLGQLIRVATSGARDAPAPWLRVVGVAPTVRQRQAGGIEPDPVVYLPSRSAPLPTMAVIVRSGGDPAILTASIREALRQLDPSLPLYRAMTMDEAMRQQQWNGRISQVLLNGIGTIALLLALVGLYAVTAHSMRLRRKELGIRMALGARPAQAAGLVLRAALIQIGIGATLGVGATLLFDRAFTASELRLSDPVVLAPTLAAIVLVGIAASLWPALRAARLDPVLALRHE